MKWSSKLLAAGALFLGMIGAALAADQVQILNGPSVVSATNPLPVTSGGASFGAAFPTTGSAIGFKNGANMQPATVDASGNININIQAGTVTTTPPANASTNVTQFGGSAVATGTGASGAGIPRVTISNDSSLAANQSVNVNQFGGSAVVTGTGASGAGIPRVTISSDSSLAANQSVNISQIGGVATAAAAVLVDGVSSPTVGSYGSYSYGFNGQSWDRLKLDSFDRLTVAGPISQGAYASGVPLAVNPTQLAGIPISVGQGYADKGTQRVSVARDNVLQVNVAQYGGSPLVPGDPRPDFSTTGIVTAVNDAVTVSTSGKSIVTVDVTNNTNVTWTFEGSADGVSWTNIYGVSVGSGTGITTSNSGQTGQFIVNVGGFSQFRIRVTAVGATPTATIALNAGAGSGNNSGTLLLLANQNNGQLSGFANGTGNPEAGGWAASGSWNSMWVNANIALHDPALGSTPFVWKAAPGTSGSGQAVPSVNFESTKATYHLAGLVTPAATPTDVINLQGSATKTVRFTHIAICTPGTAAGIADVVLIRRSTANSGGTSTSPTIGKSATADAAATLVDLVYTTNATTLGTLVSNLGAKKTLPTTAACVEWHFGANNDKEIVLSGASDFLSVNGNGDTLVTGEVWSYDFVWTEE
jgi:hypothetical protein